MEDVGLAITQRAIGRLFPDEGSPGRRTWFRGRESSIVHTITDGVETCRPKLLDMGSSAGNRDWAYGYNLDIRASERELKSWKRPKKVILKFEKGPKNSVTRTIIFH